jgi:hypothetical protein
LGSGSAGVESAGPEVQKHEPPAKATTAGRLRSVGFTGSAVIAADAPLDEGFVVLISGG